MDREVTSPLQDILQSFDRVHGRFGVGHENNGGVAALDGRICAGGQIFLVSEAGIPEVGVRVYKTRADDHSAGIDHGGAGGGHEVLLYFGNAAVVDEDVALSFRAGSGIDQVTVEDDQHRSLPSLS